MRRAFLKGLFLVFITFQATVSALAQGFLKTDGQQIVDENNNPIIWRGIGLGGWMLQEGYMLGTGGPQHTIEARIEELVGETKKEQFYDAWLANHMRKIDVDSMAAWGYNMIRLPMHYKLFTPPIEEESVSGEITWIDKGFEMVDDLLEWCKANDIYLILDLHAAPGGQGENADISDYDSSKPSLWESEANKEKMIALWRKLAERYVDEPMIAAYDIINEPNWGFQNHASDLNGCSETANSPLWDLQIRVTEAIREVDTNHIIVIEGNCWGNNYGGLPNLWDDNLVISYHKYWNANSQGAIQGMLDMRSNRNVPIWLGETGENSNTWFTNAVRLFENNDFGWSWWPLKKLGGNNPLQIKRNEGYQAILDYWNGDGAKPTEDAAFAALMQYAEDLKLENNIYHPDVVDAKIRQPHTTDIIPFKEHNITADGENIIFATDYDLGQVRFAYYDIVSENTTGNAGGATWNSGHTYRNDGVDIQECEDQTTNGYNVGWTEATEWMNYTVNVAETGDYTFSIRTAATSTSGRVSLYVDNVKATETIQLPNTGGFQQWETTSVDGVYLEEGEHVLKIYIDRGDFNFNYFQLTGPSENDAQPKIIDKKGTHEKKRVELTFSQPLNELPAEHGFSFKVNGEEVSIASLNLVQNTPQIVVFNLEEALNYHDVVLLSYSGSGITTKAGTSLAAFSDETITVQLEGGVTPISIPGKIEAEDFVDNSGFDLEETSDTGGGQNVGYTDNGDFLDYIIDSDIDAYFQVDYRVSSESAGGSLSLLTVGSTGLTTEIDRVTFPATGAWQNWSTIQGGLVHITKGLTTLRLQANASQFNINWIRLNFVSDGPPAGIGDNDAASEVSVNLYPNPNSGKFTIEYKAGFRPSRVTLLDNSGNKISDFDVPQSGNQIQVDSNLSTGAYVVVLENDKKLICKRVLVQN